MLPLFQILLVIHVAGGGLSLLLGLYILLAEKGGKRHKRAGSVYFYAMLASALAALPMSYLHPNFFLFTIGVFTAYMLLSGKRYLKKKRPADVKPVDWLLTYTMLAFGIAYIAFGAYHLSKAHLFGLVFGVFGGISLLFVRQDFSNFKGRSAIKNYWLTTHLQRMLGSYIASVTAFVVVNNNILPGVVAWLLPTVILVPLIIRWTRKNAVKAEPVKEEEQVL